MSFASRCTRRLSNLVTLDALGRPLWEEGNPFVRWAEGLSKTVLLPEYLVLLLGAALASVIPHLRTSPSEITEISCSRRG
jgi:hypothetical protein